MRKLLWIVTAIFCSNGVFAQDLTKGPSCSVDMTQGQICYVRHLNQLHPAQFNTGEQYVNGLVDKYKNATPGQNQHRLDTMLFPVVIAPDKNIYLVNEMDQLLAFYKLAQSSPYHYKYYLKVIKSFAPDNSVNTMNQFWIWMKQNNYAWLNDAGINKLPAQLPDHISALRNDRYLTLAEWLKESQWCYRGSIDNNIEFYWADYFRSLVQEGQVGLYGDPNPVTLEGLRAQQHYLDYIKRAGICHVNVADKLPGFCQYDGCSSR